MDHYYVIGNPVGHSKSPLIHAAFARQTGQAMDYQTCLAPLDGFDACVAALVAGGARGANVTVPFKLDAARLATRLSARAAAAGAVNTLCFGADGILGENTDGAGLVRDIVVNAATPLAGLRVLLLGAGGAARGVLLPLLQQGPAALVLVNRSPDRAAALVAAMQDQAQPGQLRACHWEQLDGAFDVIINATAASLAAALPPVPDTVFGPATLALDMMYGAAPTVFMAHAQARGARVRDGLGMLVEQAAEAFFLWRGVRPASAPVLRALREAL